MAFLREARARRRLSRLRTHKGGSFGQCHRDSVRRSPRGQLTEREQRKERARYIHPNRYLGHFLANYNPLCHSHLGGISLIQEVPRLAHRGRGCKTDFSGLPPIWEGQRRGALLQPPPLLVALQERGQHTATPQCVPPSRPRRTGRGAFPLCCSPGSRRRRTATVSQPCHRRD